tara:strand:- start:16393 stop:16503 length:111 start_codon:yes stop_codon:yes gene_type:complete
MAEQALVFLATFIGVFVLVAGVVFLGAEYRRDQDNA